MYNIKRPYMKPGSRLADVIFSNPALLFVLEYLDVDYMLKDKTVQEFCNEHNIDTNMFVAMSNIYNGFAVELKSDLSIDNVPLVIKFLRNTHSYYRNEKYPEIQQLIRNLHEINKSAEIEIVEKFFAEYYAEVDEHLTYEENVIFPYFKMLYDKYQGIDNKPLDDKLVIKDYRHLHTDIEYKLDELKNLLIKYIPVKQDRQIRRKLLLALCDVENDLNAHTMIETHILIPLIVKIEKILKKG